MVTTKRRFPAEPYLVAVLAVGIGLLLRGPGWSVLGTKVPFLTFFPGVIGAAWRCGLKSGLLSTVLSALVAVYFFVEPVGSIRIQGVADAVSVFVFLSVSAFISWVIEQMRGAQQAEHRARLLSEQTLVGIGDGLIATDLKGCITFMNALAEQLTGWRFPEAQNQPLASVFRIVNEETRHPVENPAARALQAGVVQGLANHTVLLTRDGREVPIDDSGAPIRDEDGALIGAVLVFRDITERRSAERKLHASREELRTTLESLTDAFSAFDRDWNITYVNRAAERLVGRSREELLGKNHWEEFPAFRGTLVEEHYRRAVAAQQAVRFEHYYVPLRAWLEVNAYPTEGGGLAVYFRDISARKLTEQRHAFLLRLDDALRPLTDSHKMTQAAARLLGEHLAVNRCAYADVEADEDTFNLTGDYNRDVPSIVGRYTFTQFGAECLRLMRAGSPYVVEDAETDPRTSLVRGSYRMTRLRSVVCVSVLKQGRFAAAMAVHQTNPRQWRPDEVELVQAVANRCWESIERARVEQELRESEERLRLATEHAEIGLWDVDERNNTLLWPARVKAMFGISPDVPVSMQDFYNGLHPEDRPATSAAYAAAADSVRRALYDVEYRTIGKEDGRIRWVAAKGRGVFDDSGRCLRVIGTATDITERKRLEQALAASEERLQQVFAQAPVAVALLRGHELIIDLANPYYREFLPGRELLGRPLATAMPEITPDLLALLHRVLDTGEPFVGHEYLAPVDRNRDGVVEACWFTFVYQPWRQLDGSVVGIVVVAVDVSTHVRARQELERVNKELEEFAYVASHDLQEPLRMVNIYSQLLLKRYLSSAPEAEEYAQFIRRGVRRMETLLTDLLTYSRTVQREEVPMGIADLSAALSEAAAVLQPRIDENRAVIFEEPLPSVRGDTQQLAHVFQNLLSNALKYRSKDRAPAIRIDARREGELWVVSVQDNGIGFEQQHAERIFGLFKRLHQDEYPGTGLGLAICQRIVERYGGRMWAEGRVGDGATFFFALPGAEVP